jgi:hypothetical protein
MRLNDRSDILGTLISIQEGYLRAFAAIGSFCGSVVSQHLPDANRFKRNSWQAPIGTAQNPGVA